MTSHWGASASAALAFSLAVWLGACTPPEGRPASPSVRPPSPTGPPAPTPASPTSMEGSTGAPSSGPPISERTVTLRDYSFQPTTMEVDAGAEVHLTVINRANHEHSWVLMEKDYAWEEPFDAADSAHGLARVTVDTLGRDLLIFIAPTAPGEYPVVCSIPGHVEYGMVGSLIVR